MVFVFYTSSSFWKTFKLTYVGLLNIQKENDRCRERERAREYISLKEKEIVIKNKRMRRRHFHNQKYLNLMKTVRI